MSGQPFAEFNKVPLIDKVFWELVDKGPGPDDCWLWTGKVIDQGGIRAAWFCRKSYSIAANRYAWQSCNNKFLSTRMLLRDCETELCVRPEHYRVVPASSRRTRSGPRKKTVESSPNATVPDANSTPPEAVIVSVRTPEQLQAPIVQPAPPVDLAPVVRELSVHRAALAKVLRYQATISESLSSIASSLTALRDRPVATAKDVDRIIDALESLRALPDAQTPETKVAAPSLMSAIAEAYSHGDSGALTYTDLANLSELARLASNASLTEEQNRERALQWIETFLRLVTSGVVKHRTSDLLEAARVGWLQEGLEPA